MSCQHSPLPWKVESSTCGDFDLMAGDDTWVGITLMDALDGELHGRNAALIVRAVNAHAELLAALKALRSIAAANLCDIADCGCITSQVFADADAAIAKAEGDQR